LIVVSFILDRVAYTQKSILFLFLVSDSLSWEITKSHSLQPKTNT